MKFVWEDEVDIGYYTCYLYDDSGKELQNIYFRDHTTDHNIKFDQENGYERYSAYETGYCHGWSSHECIDCDEDYYKHFDENGKRLFGLFVFGFLTKKDIFSQKCPFLYLLEFRIMIFYPLTNIPYLSIIEKRYTLFECFWRLVLCHIRLKV